MEWTKSSHAERPRGKSSLKEIVFHLTKKNVRGSISNDSYENMPLKSENEDLVKSSQEEREREESYSLLIPTVMITNCWMYRRLEKIKDKVRHLFSLENLLPAIASIHIEN